MLVCKAYEGCKLAVELHSELSIRRHETDLLDEPTNAFGGPFKETLVLDDVSNVLTNGGANSFVVFGRIGRHGLTIPSCLGEVSRH